jgi:hypothetical protein
MPHNPTHYIFQSRFKQSEIYRNNLGEMNESARVANALYLLQEQGCVAMEKIYGATGKPSEH